MGRKQAWHRSPSRGARLHGESGCATSPSGLPDKHGALRDSADTGSLWGPRAPTPTRELSQSWDLKVSVASALTALYYTRKSC